MNSLKSALITSALALAAIQPATASVVSSLSGGTVVSFPVDDYFGPGPISFGPGITWSSTNASNQGGSVFGYNEGYGFSGNGYWDINMVGLNDSFAAYGVTDTMTFAFSTPLSAVGGFLNYVPGYGPATIAVYDSSNNLIESDSLSFLTGGGTDTGEFVGFLEGSADISSFTLTDSYVGIAGLTLNGTSSVPDTASTLALLGLGLAGICLLGRRSLRTA